MVPSKLILKIESFESLMKKIAEGARGGQEKLDWMD